MKRLPPKAEVEGGGRGFSLGWGCRPGFYQKPRSDEGEGGGKAFKDSA